MLLVFIVITSQDVFTLGEKTKVHTQDKFWTLEVSERVSSLQVYFHTSEFVPNCGQISQASSTVFTIVAKLKSKHPLIVHINAYLTDIAFIQLVFNGLDEAAYIYKNNSNFQFSCSYLCLNGVFAPCGVFRKTQLVFSCHVGALSHVNQHLEWITFTNGAVHTQSLLGENPRTQSGFNWTQ